MALYRMPSLPVRVDVYLIFADDRKLVFENAAPEELEFAARELRANIPLSGELFMSRLSRVGAWLRRYRRVR